MEEREREREREREGEKDCLPLLENFMMCIYIHI